MIASRSASAGGRLHPSDEPCDLDSYWRPSLMTPWSMISLLTTGGKEAIAALGHS